MLLFNSWSSFFRLLGHAFFPNRDGRRGFAKREGALLSEIQRLRTTTDDDTSIGSKVSEQTTFLLAAFEDCTGHIKHYKTEHWVVASFFLSAQIVVTYGILTLGAYFFDAFPGHWPKYFVFLLPLLIGCFGLVLLNELSVALERNRRHLDTLRFLMGGYISEIYVDLGTDGSLVSRQEQKRELELITHLCFVLMSILCIVLVIFATSPWKLL